MRRQWSAIPLSMVAIALLSCTGCAMRNASNPGVDPPPAAAILDAKGAEKRIEAQARYASGLAFELNGRPEEALRDFILSVRADPSNEEVAMEVSRRLLLAKDAEQAVEIAELAAAVPNASAGMHAHLAVLYAERGQTKDAIRANRRAIELSPGVLTAYYNLYNLHLGQQDDGEALATLDEAAGREDESADYWLDLAELYANYLRARPERRDEIVDRLRGCLEKSAALGLQGPLRRQKLADGFALIGETDKAVALFLELLEESEDNPRLRDLIRQKLLALYITNQDADGALKQIESIVGTHPDNPQANFLLATVAYEKNDLPKAITYFRKTIELKPDYEQAYYSLAGALINSGNDAEAIELLKTTREKWPDSFVAQYYSGIVFSRAQRHEEALKHFKFAEQIASNNAPGRLDFNFYFQMGAQLERNGLYEEAAKSFKRCLDLKQDHAQALNYLGYMWADLGIHLEEARKLIQKAVDLEPMNPAFLDSLAWVLYRLDQPNLALTYMEEAMKHQEEPDATLFDHLGDIHFAIGNQEEAMKAWRRSFEIEANPKVQKKLDGEAPIPAKPTT